MQYWGENMSGLAILGGNPIFNAPLPPYLSLGKGEEEAVLRVVRSGSLSSFYGSPGDEFYGGREILAFEKAWKKLFTTNHAVSVNSATSGLYAAMGAIGIGPGDEVIVPPYTMSATVMAPLVYGAVPVFADIEPETFGLDPASVRQAVTGNTRAILAVNLFGHPARLDELKKIAVEYGLFLVEDNAQSPLAEDNGRLTGTIGDIGIFSLNFHKHIHTGEGGMCVTDNDDLALRLKLIRNHGENAITHYEIDDITNLVGFNYRMTELQAAIGLEQINNIDQHVGKREELALFLTENLKDMPGINVPKIRSGCRHVFYVWALRYDANIVGISRNLFCKALNAEGVPVFEAYVKPMYLLPVFQRKIAFGSKGYPFNLSPSISYSKGLCPVCELLYEKELIGFEPCAYTVNREAAEKIITAFNKIYENIEDLKSLERRLLKNA